MKLTLKLPSSTFEPSQNLATPSGIPEGLSGDIGNSGAAFFQTGINLLLYAATALSIMMLMWGGIQWITSSGDPERLAAAKRKITFAIIGLVVSVGAFFIVRVIIIVLGGNADNLLNPAVLFNATSSASLK